MEISTIESRFKEVTGLTDLDLAVRHFEKGNGQQQVTDKARQKQFGFVTTPLWLVDEMVAPEIPNLKLDSRTCDACSGCGQFSIRLMRKFHYKLLDMGVSKEKADKFILEHWLPKNHWFTEFQFSNVAKLVYIFGSNINVYVGDSINMKYTGENESGLLFFNPKEKKWVNLPNLLPYIEPLKDDLDALLLVFDSLENKIGNCK